MPGLIRLLGSRARVVKAKNKTTLTSVTSLTWNG